MLRRREGVDDGGGEETASAGGGRSRLIVAADDGSRANDALVDCGGGNGGRAGRQALTQAYTRAAMTGSARGRGQREDGRASGGEVHGCAKVMLLRHKRRDGRAAGRLRQRHSLSDATDASTPTIPRNPTEAIHIQARHVWIPGDSSRGCLDSGLAV